MEPIESYANNPKFFNVDATMEKRGRIRGRSVWVGVEAFNVFNIPQRDRPRANVFDTSGFGRYSTIDQPRAVQCTVQFDF